jgi:hypothetical protein
MHLQVMKLGGPLPPDHPAPLAGVPADSGPILAIASLTLSKDPAARNSPLPVSQIAIELYQPLAGIHREPLCAGKREGRGNARLHASGVGQEVSYFKSTSFSGMSAST